MSLLQVDAGPQLIEIITFVLVPIALLYIAYKSYQGYRAFQEVKKQN